MSPWPYPFWIAHRGAGQLAPENTLAAFRFGEQQGYRMFECDVRLSADDVVFLLHDDTLERTTNGQGMAGKRRWDGLRTLDAGGWHSPTHSGERLLLLSTLASWCIGRGLMLNIEIKPTPGTERHTGTRVAHEAARLWSDVSVPPLLTSFSPDALQAAREAAPHLPRGLLLDTLDGDWLLKVQALSCVAVVCHHPLWDADNMAQAKASGLRCLSYTVNEAHEAQRLKALGIDGLITDQVDLFRPD